MSTLFAILAGVQQALPVESPEHSPKSITVLKDPAARQGLAPLVQVQTQATSVVLATARNPAGAEALALPAMMAVCPISISSPLPEWSVRVRLVAMQGPEGPLPPERITLQPADGSGVQGGASMWIIGHGPVPVRDLELKITVRPEWEDSPGAYKGILEILGVPGPPDEQVDGQRWDPGWKGQEIAVPVSTEIPGMIMVGAAEGEYRLSGGTGLGRFTLEPDIHVRIASNLAQWDVRLDGSPFRSGSNEVPLDRVEWAWVGPDGAPGDWTSLQESNLLLSGRKGRGCFDETLRLSLFVRLSDSAGDYRSQIRLAGSGG